MIVCVQGISLSEALQASWLKMTAVFGSFGVRSIKALKKRCVSDVSETQVSNFSS